MAGGFGGGSADWVAAVPEQEMVLVCSCIEAGSIVDDEGTHHEHGPLAMSQSVDVTPAFLDRILTLLAPLFLAATGGDMEVARETVRETLADYGARTDNELRLAALVVSFGFGSLDALSKAANSALSLDEVMDLRDNATALSDAGYQCQTALDKLQRQRPVKSVAADLPASLEGPELVMLARAAAEDAPAGRVRQVGAGVKARQAAPGGRTVH